jgi:hypothetical protein
MYNTPAVDSSVASERAWGETGIMSPYPAVVIVHMLK